MIQICLEDGEIMMAPGYKGIKHTPLTPEELKDKIVDVNDEMKEVLEWKKEEEDKLKKDNFKTHQAKSACIRNLKKVERRVNSVKGMQQYWKDRNNGVSHFRASIDLNEYWASLKEKEQAEKKKVEEAELPNLLKKKL